ncbi:hypothetical protein FQR65_LT09188 [Abscondita terminalis]|nr:hypothetical protein FQR65_LT09188 [Abscondita terminalis]
MDDQETQTSILKDSFESWKEIILLVHSVLLWEKNWYPGAILGGTSFLFLTLWLVDASILSTLSILGLTITISDYVVPIVAAVMFKPESWCKDKDQEFYDICRNIVGYKMKLEESLSTFYETRVTNPKMYYGCTISTLAGLAWIGNSFNNLFLTYLFITTLLLVPGLEHHGDITSNLKNDILELKKELAIVKNENHLLKVKVRKLQSEISKKDKQIEILIDPDKSFMIKKVVSEKGASMIVALRDRIKKMEKTINDKDGFIRRLQSDLQTKKLYMVKSADKRKTSGNKANKFNLSIPFFENECDFECELRSICKIDDNSREEDDKKECKISERRSTSRNESEVQNLGLLDVKAQYEGLPRSHLLCIIENLKNNRQRLSPTPRHNESPESDIERCELECETPHVEIQQLQNYFMDILSEVDQLKVTISTLKNEQEKTNSVLKEKNSSIEYLAKEIECLRNPLTKSTTDLTHLKSDSDVQKLTLKMGGKQFECNVEQLYRWIDEYPLTRPKKNISRDFSDAIPLAEILKNHYPKLVDLHNYTPRNSVCQKLINWQTLNRKVLSKIDLSIPNSTLEQLANSEQGVIEKILFKVKERIETKPIEKNPDVCYIEGLSSNLSGSVISLKQKDSSKALDHKIIPMETFTNMEQAIQDKTELVESLSNKIQYLESLLIIKDERINDLTHQIQQMSNNTNGSSIVLISIALLLQSKLPRDNDNHKASASMLIVYEVYVTGVQIKN